MMKSTFWNELWWLLVYVAAGLVVTLGVMMLALSTNLPSVAWPGWLVIQGAVVQLHLVQWTQTLCLMLLPPLLWARFYVKEPVREVLALHRPRWQWMAWTALLMIASLPLMDCLSMACRHIPWPARLRDIALAQQLQQDHLFGLMLSPTGWLGCLELVLLMSVATAIGEEFLFRGALLRCFRGSFLHQTQRTPRQTAILTHTSAVIVGLVFSLIHFDIFGLLPRWLLGTLFAYLVWWSRSLWPAVLAHALNNLFALVEYKLSAPVLPDGLPEGAALQLPPAEAEAWLGAEPVLVLLSAVATLLLLVKSPQNAMETPVREGVASASSASNCSSDMEPSASRTR